MKKIFSLLMLWLMLSSMALNAQTINAFPWKEGFESGAIPIGWTQFQETGNFSWTTEYSSTNAHTGSYHAKFRAASSNSPATWLITPPIDLSNMYNCVLSFWYYSKSWSTAIDTLGVFYRPASGGDWIYIGSYNQATCAGERTVPTWRQLTYYLSYIPSTEPIQIGFRAWSDYAYGLGIDDIVLDGNDVSNCLRTGPLSVSAITYDNATITWGIVGTPTDWFVSYLDHSSGTWSSEVMVDDTTFNFNTNPLNSNSWYSVRVRSYCGIGDTSAYRSISFKTLCHEEIPFLESFDNTATGSSSAPIAPSCWSYVQEYSLASACVSSSSPYSPPHCFYLNNNNTTSQKTALISPLFIDDLSDLRIQFHARGSFAGTLLKVGYLTTNGDINTFVLLQDITLSSAWTQYVVDFAEFDTLTQEVTNIVFLHGNAATSQAISIDDIIIDRIPPCENVNPSDFHIPDGATLTSITINNGDEASNFNNYIFKYRKAGSTVWSNDVITNALPYTITDLEHSSPYEIIAKGVCTEGESFWSSAINIGWTAFPIPLTETFEANYRTGKGWSLQRDNTASSMTSATISGSYYSPPGAVHINNGATESDHLNYYISPKLDITDAFNTLQVRFKAKASSINMNVAVGIMNADDINSFVAIETLPLSTTWATYIVSFENYNGTDAHIALGHLNNPASSSIYFDDIHIETIPSCSEVANITYTNLNHEGITLAWQEDGASSHTIKYVKTGSTDSTVITVLDDNTYTITGLDPVTNYVVTLSNNCQPNSWSPPYSFTTTTIPYSIPFNEDFEELNHPFVFKNGSQTNQWIVGSDSNALPPGSTKSLYISNNDSLYAYSHSTSHVYAYTSLHFESGGSYQIEYDWLCNGEASNDYAQVWLAPTNAAFFAGSAPTTSGWINAYESNLNSVATWQHRNITFNIQNEGFYNLIIYWKNDNDAGSTPIAIDNISIVKNPCDNVISLASSYPTSNSVDITFTTFASTTDVRLYYKISSDTNWTDSVDLYLPSLSNSTYGLDGLNSGSTYAYAAKTICSSFESTISPTYTFQTTCSSHTLPWMENFSTTNFPPTICWERKTGRYTPDNVVYTENLSNNTSWTRTTVSGSPAAQINISGTSVCHWLISPVFHVENDNDFILSLDLLFSNSSNGSSAPSGNIADDKFIILLSTDGGVSWEPENKVVWTSNETGDYRLDSLTNTFRKFNIPLAYYSGDVRIAFYAESTVSGGNNYLFVDNIAIANCPRPTDLNTTNMTAQSVTINWLSTAENAIFEYAVSEFSSTPDESDVSHTNDLFVDLDNLTENTDYYFLVRTKCDGNNSSEWASLHFTTSCFPLAIPFYESFEDTTTHCWRVINNNEDGDQWELSSNANHAHTGTHSYQIHTDFNAGNNDDYLISPQFILTGNEFLKFYTKSRATNEPDQMRVLVSTTGISPSEFTFEVMPLTTIEHDTFRTYTIDLSTFQGNASIAFHVPPGGLDGCYINIDDISIESYPNCTDPIGIAVNDFHIDQAILSWRIPGFASDVTDVQLIYGECGIDTLTETAILLQPTETTFLLTGLNYQTCYDIYLKSNCSGGNTSWIKYTYTTPCAKIMSDDLPYAESFDTYGVGSNAYVDCWSRINTQSSLMSYPHISSIHNSAPGSLYFYGSPTTNVVAITPQFDATINLSALQLFFKLRTSALTAGLCVGVMDDPADMRTFTPIDTIYTTATGQFQEFYAPLSTYNGTGKYIAFKYEGTTTSYIYLDDLEISYIPTCPEPRNVTVTAIDHQSAQVSWNRNPDGEESSWEIVVDVEGFDINTFAGTPISATDTSWTVSNLASNTSYDVYVRAVCDNPTDIWWSRKQTFKTDCTPLTITDLPYVESFDSYGTGTNVQPDCWKSINTFSTTSSYPYIVAIYPAIGVLHFHGSSTTTVIGILPALDATVSVNTLMMRFHFQATGITSGVEVGVMIDPEDEATFETVATINPALTSVWEYREVYFENYTGEGKHVALRYLPGTSAGMAYIDDLTLELIPSCKRPENLTAQYDPATRNLTLDWDDHSTASQWEVIYSSDYTFDPTENPGTGTTIIVNSNPCTISNLPESVYYFSVRTICSAGDTSEWSILDAKAFVTCQSTTGLPYYQDFESYTIPTTTYADRGMVPECWTAFSDNAKYHAPKITNSGTYHYPASGSEKALTFTNGMEGANSFAVLPEFAAPFNTLSIAFSYKMENADNGILYIGYMTDNLDVATFVSLKEIVSTSSIARDSVSMRNYTIPAEAKHLAFKWQQAASFYSCGVDNIHVITSQAAPTEYTITPSVEGSGSVNPSSAVQVVEGGSQTFTFTPGANYELSQVLVDNVATSYDTTGRSYTFANVQANHTIKGVFTLIGSVDDYVLNNRVIIYPNPANSTVNVKTEVMFQTVEITNMLGQVIYTSFVNDTHFQLNVSHLTAGIYFIRLQGENGTAVKKLRIEN